MAAENSNEIAYDFTTWDAQQFRRSGELLTRLVQHREAISDARSAILRLYFMDNPELEQ